MHAQNSLINSLRSLPPSLIKQAIDDTLTDQEADAILHDWELWARPSQLPTAGDWRTWLVLAGRGWGKTRVGAEWVRKQVELGRRRIALVAPTAGDARDVMVEGESGLLAIFPAHQRPLYEPSKRRVTFANGALATLYSADEPERLRGPQHDAAWCDEICAWKYLQEAWDMLMFGLRLGDDPRCVVTTTPKPIPLVRELLADEHTCITRGATSENKANLAPAFLAKIVAKYEGTRLGRQELYAEVLDDVPGALWTRDGIEKLRVKHTPKLVRIVVAVDPSVSSSDEADECGIVAVGEGDDGHGYLLEDATVKGSPDTWGRAAVNLYHKWGADRLVAEVNNGGDLVESLIRTIDPRVAYKAVRASRGKVRRAEPVAALYEQGRFHHVGMFGTLEDQLCMLTPDNSLIESPDRADALVWAATELLLNEQRPMIAPEFSPALHVCDTIPARLSRYCAILPRLAGSHAILWAGADKWGDVWVYRELLMPSGDFTLREHGDAVASLEGGVFILNRPGTDSEGGRIQDVTERVRVRLMAAYEMLEEQVEDWQARFGRYGLAVTPCELAPGLCDDVLKTWLRGRVVDGAERPRLHVAESCPQLIDELRTVRAEPRNKGEREPVLIECLRALAGYGVRWSESLES